MVVITVEASSPSLAIAIVVVPFVLIWVVIGPVVLTVRIGILCLAAVGSLADVLLVELWLCRSLVEVVLVFLLDS